MNICFDEPTIDELFGDGLTQSLMRADRVDAFTLRTMLQRMAACRNPTIALNDRIQGLSSLASISDRRLGGSALITPGPRRRSRHEPGSPVWKERSLVRAGSIHL